MTDTSLTEAVDSWTAQAVMASGYLARLYRGLGDERQADLAAQACGSCGERAQRLGLVARIAALDTTFTLEHPEETIGEEKAWQLLVGAHAGLHAFLGLVDGDEQGRATGEPGEFPIGGKGAPAPGVPGQRQQDGGGTDKINGV